MRPRVLTATQALADRGGLGPDVSAPSAALLRPFLDLAGEGGPINARVARYAGLSLDPATGDPDDAAWLPNQSNTKSRLRTQLIRDTGLHEYDVTWPAQLALPLRTALWQVLCDTVAARGEIAPARRYRLVCALYKLGLFRAAVEVGSGACTTADLGGLTVLRVASAMSKLGHPTHDLVGYAVDVWDAAPRGGRARLAAAINLTVHFARASRDAAATQLWAARIHEAASGLRPTERPVDRMLASMALRAASFGPFVRRDHAAVAEHLDGAEQSARAMLTDPSIPAVLSEENLFAVLETRTNEAVIRGDREAALRHATALTAHDPLEPKTWLQLGAVHSDDRRYDSALDAYRTAAALGAPFTATAWYCVARCQEELGDHEGACHAYTSSVAAEPLGITALHGLYRTARRTGQAAAGRWAADRLARLHARSAPPPPTLRPPARTAPAAEPATTDGR